MSTYEVGSEKKTTQEHTLCDDSAWFLSIWNRLETRVEIPTIFNMFTTLWYCSVTLLNHGTMKPRLKSWALTRTYNTE